MVPKVTKRRLKWAKPRQAMLKGAVLSYPAGVSERYSKAISALTEPMVKEYEREIYRLNRQFGITEDGRFTSDASYASQMRILFSKLDQKWSKIFTDRSKTIVERMIGQTDRYSKATLTQSLKDLSGGITIKTPDMPAGLSDILTASTAANVELITSIQSQYQSRIEGAVMRSIQTGGEGSKTVYDEIRSIGEKEAERANAIAVDQTRKITTAMRGERMKAAGITKFEWLHSSGGVNPRPLHVSYNGQVFDINDPPVIDERTGEKGLPGQLINCRCKMRPVLDFDQYAD